jgi:hypothetical protein
VISGHTLQAASRVNPHKSIVAHVRREVAGLPRMASLTGFIFIFVWNRTDSHFETWFDAAKKGCAGIEYAARSGARGKRFPQICAALATWLRRRILIF